MNEARYRAAEQQLWQSVGLVPTERRLQLARVSTTVRIQEVGEGPPVLFVHGATTSGASWSQLVARLDGYRCVLLDRPGCGLSDPVPARFEDLESWGSFAETLVADVLDAMELDRVPVVATSYGGFIAFRTAAAHPDRIDRMVLFGYPVGANRMPLPLRLASVPPVGRLMSALPINERTTRSMLRRIGLRHAVDAGKMSQESIDWYVALLRDTDTMRNEVRAGPRFPVLRMDNHALLPADLLARVTTPVQLLWGEEDPFGGEAVARRLVRYLPHVELELMPGAGHAVWVDDPDHAATVTRRFLDR